MAALLSAYPFAKPWYFEGAKGDLIRKLDLFQNTPYLVSVNGMTVII
jgi:hypothetical protein